MKAIFKNLLTFIVLIIPFGLYAQSALEPYNDEQVQIDTSVAKPAPYYKTAEIAFEIENVKRYVKGQTKKIESYQNVAEVDSTFSDLRNHITKEFDEFATLNKLNLSKFFLLNTKRVWLSYRYQLVKWQVDVSYRINNLMQVSGKIKEKEKLWVATANQPRNNLLPKGINTRITNSLNDLYQTEKYLYEVVGNLSVLESKITDQIIDVDEHIGIIDELQENYRSTLLKPTEPLIWNVNLKDSFEGTVGERLQKAWYENTKSLNDSLPSFSDNLSKFIWWIILIIIVIAGIRYLYFKQNKTQESLRDKDIDELIIQNPILSTVFLTLFVFDMMFNNIPLSLSAALALIVLVVTYYLVKPYLKHWGKRLIISFIVLLLANILEIIFWYFGNYARLYLILEAGLGIILVYHFVRKDFKEDSSSGLGYYFVANILRYPAFALYVLALLVNLIGFQSLSVLFLKIATQISISIIILIAVWEISKSSLFTLFRVVTRFKHFKSHRLLQLVKTRLTWFLGLFFGLVWFHTFLGIVELDTPFYKGLEQVMHSERHLGSFVFTYGAIFQFIIIMLITWGLTSVISIVFNEGNFKKTQRLRGVPAAISTTLRLIIALSGFFLALSGAGIDLTKISIMIGAFSVGIGFGLQNVVNNFISGLILIYERPIQVGDTIEINTLLGKVKSIGIRSSNVRTFDGAEVVVPNSILVSDQLINWTLSDDKRRIEVVVGVKYGTNPTKVIELLKQVANNHEKVAKEPQPVVLFNEFADSSLNFRLLCWVLFEHGIRTKSDLSVAIDKAFKENKIEIPFPQIDLHVIDTPKGKDND